MRATRRNRWRGGLALVSALSLVVVGTSASSAAEEEGTKNLSTPVILVDDSAFSAAFNPVTASVNDGLPTGTADYTKETLDYYTGVSSEDYTSTIDLDGFDADMWGADWVAETEEPVLADVKWGDNLMSHVFPGNRKQPIRVEVNLFADETMAEFYGDMMGYTTVSLEGEHENELFGTLGEAEPLAPMVYTPDATLTILQYNEETDWYSDVILDATAMSAEVNGSGKVIYGFNWGSPSGLAQPGPGNYRLIFEVGEESLVFFDEALAGDDAEEEGAIHTPYIYGDKISYLDMAVGTVPLIPPLPFVQPLKDTDFTGDGYADVIARDTKGNLWLYPGNGSGGWLPRKLMGTGWQVFNSLFIPGDFSGDGNPDVLARDTLGNLYLYKGDGAGYWLLPRVKVGSGWQIFNALVGPGDWNGDGTADVLARDTAGNLWLYPGNGTGGWLPRVKIGLGWQIMTSIVGPGDFSGDGNADVLARDTAGTLWLYPGNGTGGWLPRVKAGSGWQIFTALVGPGDFSGDELVDVLARDKLGNLYLYKGDGAGYWLLPSTKVGLGWNIMTTILS